MEGKMVIGMNKHREICTFQVTGSMLLLRDQVRSFCPAVEDFLQSSLEWLFSVVSFTSLSQ